jgi:hypothetical protein
VQPRNYETKLLRVSPRVHGVELTGGRPGDGLRLTNDTSHDVTVLGYDGEPYLRVGPRGVFENTRSPATYLNRSRVPTSKPPKPRRLECAARVAKGVVEHDDDLARPPRPLHGERRSRRACSATRRSVA